MDDLVEFLRARLAEDAAVAREAADGDSGDWFVGDKWNVYRVEDETPHDVIEENRLVVYGAAKAQSEHIARHDPARVLAEVEAKRELLDVYEDADEGSRDADGYVDYEHGQYAVTLLTAIRILAVVYAAHPDYRPEWAPDA